jgi:hypothetical protein
MADLSPELLENLQATIQDQAEALRALESLVSGLDERLQRMERDLGI